MSTADETARVADRLATGHNYGTPLYGGANETIRDLVASLQHGDDYDAPTNVTATADSATQITLEWDWFPGADHFSIDISEDEEEWTPVDATVEALSLAVMDLTTATEYFFRVQAVTGGRVSEYGTDSATTS